MTEVLNFFGTSILLLILALIATFIAIILPNIIGNYIDGKREEKEKKDGIEGRYVTIGYGFYIYIVHKNEKYYLNKDGNFYTSRINIKEYLFNNKQDMEKYIDLHEKELNEKYSNIKIQRCKQSMYIGKCKKIELGD